MAQPPRGHQLFSPSYSPDTEMVYVANREMGSVYFKGEVEYEPGKPFMGGGEQAMSGDEASGSVKALDVRTGEVRWRFGLLSPPVGGCHVDRGWAGVRWYQ